MLKIQQSSCLDSMMYVNTGKYRYYVVLYFAKQADLLSCNSIPTRWTTRVHQKNHIHQPKVDAIQRARTVRTVCEECEENIFTSARGIVDWVMNVEFDAILRRRTSLEIKIGTLKTEGDGERGRETKRTRAAQT